MPVRSAVDSDLAEISARISAMKKYNMMQKAQAAEKIITVMARAMNHMAQRLDELEEFR